jgi:hypothetical protein
MAWLIYSRRMPSLTSKEQKNLVRRVKVKSLGFTLFVVLMSPFASAQSHAHESQPQRSEAQESVVQTAPSDAQKAFEKLKSLAGSWEGHPKVVPSVPSLDGKSAHVTFRVASRGHTLMHDLKIESIPDNPITMLVVDADRLLLTHYCDADNRPRMIGKMSADGKAVEFDFLDISGNVKTGHMHHAVFTFVDENHHIEEWTFMMLGDNPVHVRFDLERTKQANGAPGE